MFSIRAKTIQPIQHLDDIASIVRLLGSKLDQQGLDVVAAGLGLLGVWRALWGESRPVKPLY